MRVGLQFAVDTGRTMWTYVLTQEQQILSIMQQEKPATELALDIPNTIAEQRGSRAMWIRLQTLALQSRLVLLLALDVA